MRNKFNIGDKVRVETLDKEFTIKSISKVKIGSEDEQILYSEYDITEVKIARWHPEPSLELCEKETEQKTYTAQEIEEAKKLFDQIERALSYANTKEFACELACELGRQMAIREILRKVFKW